MTEIETLKPLHADAETLHAEIDRLVLGPYAIEWGGSSLTVRFDRDLDLHEIELVESSVSSHDGSSAIAAREALQAQIRTIKETSAPLAESARAKRLRGEALSQGELAALMDFALFGA